MKKSIFILVLALLLANSAFAQNNTASKYAPKAVDLGLPSGTLWSDRNLGLTENELEYGNYYCWGAIKSYPDDDQAPRILNWRTYRYGSAINNLSKYCTDSSYGNVDNKTQLESEDDAAQMFPKLHKTQIYGGKWRTPTDKEFQELIDKCEWIYQTRSGVAGFTVKGPNGNTIFFPFNGYHIGDRKFGLRDMGGYLTSTLCDEYPSYAYIVLMADDYVGCMNGSRKNGYAVRPVMSKK
ncbi:MAG: hypothetical protein KBT29_06130 [Prevotellaceae bacterium]|nr:hypothetical protein [Candidatus Minthosoma caballi]